jgi:hypothetical protein
MSATTVGYRLSPQQKRAWQLLLENNGNGCAVEGVLLIEGRIEPRNLEERLDDIVKRHEILRTGFQALSGASIPIQVVSDRGFHFDKILDLSGLGEAEQKIEIEKIKQEARQPFLSLEQGALMRVTLITLAPENQLFSICDVRRPRGAH